MWKLMSVVKDVDLEVMPTPIFLNDDDEMTDRYYWPLELLVSVLWKHDANVAVNTQDRLKWR